MKLEKYEDKSKKKRKIVLISISVIVLISVSFLLYKTFASFTESVEFQVMNGKVDYFGNSDIYFAFYQGDKELEEMPEKDNEDNLVFSHGECDNGANVEWDSEEWAPLVINLKNSKTKCSLYFNRPIELGKDILPVENGDGLYAVTHDNLEELSSEWNKTEYRFAGVNPNNYVRFNNEIWRIIGLVNVKTESGNIEQRIKIIRQDGIEGQKDFGAYSWDFNQDNKISNDWTNGQLKDMLNGIYYESTIGDCYQEIKTKTNCDFTGNGDLPKGFNKTARKMIDSEIIWNLGGWNGNHAAASADMIYEKERGTTVFNSDSISRPIEWSKTTDIGNKKNGVALMYASDYGYAVGREVRSDCLIKSLSDYNKNNCNTNNWLYTKKETRLLMPQSSDSSNIFLINSAGYVYSSFWASDRMPVVWPVIYLTSNTKITWGTGELNSPFTVSLN